MSVEEYAGELYEAYCAAVGGKAFNGDPLPNWKTFRADENKKVQSNAWVTVGATAIRRLAALSPVWPDGSPVLRGD